MPKDSTKYISFRTMDDVSFTRDGSQMNVHLATGQIAEIAYDVVERAYKAMKAVRNPTGELVEVARVHDAVVYDYGAIEIMQWPRGLADAPIWRTADDRVLPVTEMTDYHLANALRRVQSIVRSYPDTKNINHYKQWVKWFGMEFERRKRGR